MDSRGLHRGQINRAARTRAGASKPSPQAAPGHPQVPKGAVTITGSGFGATQGASTVTFNGADAGAATSWSDTSITVVVPSAAAVLADLQQLVVTVNGISSPPATFLVTPAPEIAGLSPQTGPASTAVTITGTNFGAAQGGSIVTFGGMGAGTAAAWSDTSITVYVPLGAATGDVIVNVGGVPSNARPFTVLVPPAVSAVMPLSGPVGTLVAILGSGFGATQGASTVTFAGTLAAAVSWSDTRIDAAVPVAAGSGDLVVTVGGMSSTGVYFRVTVAPIISSVSPLSARPGDPVTINGTGFGSQQGSGLVWAGTAYGTVATWSDTQIVATVAAGSLPGTVRVLQDGIWSNAVPLQVEALTITSVSPNAGATGTAVTIDGTGFGATQGTGTVQVGSAPGTVLSWSESEIVAAVAAGSVSGIVQVQQGGMRSNALTFTVPAGSGAVTMPPNLLNLEVGATRTLQALDGASQPVSGLTWSTSDAAVVSLSSADPPELTALAAGHATIAAGGASADVTVWDTSGLLEWTVVSSNPGNASGVVKIVPAVPSASGVADVFAFQGDGTGAVYPGSYVEYAQKLGHEAPGIHA